MGHAPKVGAEEPIDWDLGIAVKETEKHFVTDLQILMKQPKKRSEPPTQENVKSGETPLVATDHRRHTEEMRKLRPLQNVSKNIKPN